MSPLIFYALRCVSLKQNKLEKTRRSQNEILEWLEIRVSCWQNLKDVYNRMSTTRGNTWNILEFLIPSGNTGSLLEFNWSSWKFLTDGITTKASSHKNLAPVQLFGRWWCGDDEYVYILWWLRLLGKQDHHDLRSWVLLNLLEICLVGLVETLCQQGHVGRAANPLTWGAG